MTKKVQTPKVIRQILIKRLSEFVPESINSPGFRHGLFYGLCPVLVGLDLKCHSTGDKELSKAIKELLENIDYVLDYSERNSNYSFDYLPSALFRSKDRIDIDTQRYIRLKWLDLWEEEGIAATYDYFNNAESYWTD